MKLEFLSFDFDKFAQALLPPKGRSVARNRRRGEFHAPGLKATPSKFEGE